MRNPWIWSQSWRWRGDDRLDESNYHGLRLLMMVLMLAATDLSAALDFSTIGRLWWAQLAIWLMMLVIAWVGQRLAVSNRPVAAAISLIVLSSSFGWMYGMVSWYLRLPSPEFVVLLAMLVVVIFAAPWVAGDRFRRPEFWAGLLERFWRLWPLWALVVPTAVMLLTRLDWRIALQTVLVELFCAWILRTLGRSLALDRTLVNVYGSTAAVYADLVFLFRVLADMALHPGR